MHFSNLGGGDRRKVLDFGCGRGQLVGDFRKHGYEAYGCDHWLTYEDQQENSYLKKIELDPYKLPFDSNTFDFVVSTSVFEHAQNTEECFREIARVLKPGGYAMHILPGKWYLPKEPHIYVPLVNWFWPICPKWWFRLWAWLGVRNEFQNDLDDRVVAQKNFEYSATGLNYRTTYFYNRTAKKMFGRVFWPMGFYIRHADGGFAKLARRLPFKSLSGLLSREFRMGFFVTQK